MMFVIPLPMWKSSCHIWKLKLKGKHLRLIAAFQDKVGCLLSLLFAFDSSFHTLISAKSLTPKFSAKNSSFSDQKISSASGFVKLAPLPFLMSTCGACVAETKTKNWPKFSQNRGTYQLCNMYNNAMRVGWCWPYTHLKLEVHKVQQ